MVDRIGKGGAPPPGAGAPGPARPAETGKTFDVEKPGAARPSTDVKVEATAPQPLAQLKAGKIDFNEYLDIKVREATGHLQGLTKVQLETVRGMLRDRMSTDPELVDLLKTATGQVPTTDE